MIVGLARLTDRWRQFGFDFDFRGRLNAGCELDSRANLIVTERVQQR